MNTTRRVLGSVGAGTLGALAMAGANRLARERWKMGKPGMELVREHILTRAARRLTGRRLRGRDAERIARIGNAVNAGLFYALLLGRRTQRPILRGALGGLIAGVAAVALPAIVDRKARRLEPRTTAMTIGWYALGGLAAAIAWRGLGTRPVI
jgi:hypothetical protein